MQDGCRYLFALHAMCLSDKTSCGNMQKIRKLESRRKHIHAARCLCSLVRCHDQHIGQNLHKLEGVGPTSNDTIEKLQKIFGLKCCVIQLGCKGM